MIDLSNPVVRHWAGTRVPAWMRDRPEEKMELPDATRGDVLALDVALSEAGPGEETGGPRDVPDLAAYNLDVALGLKLPEEDATRCARTLVGVLARLQTASGAVLPQVRRALALLGPAEFGLTGYRVCTDVAATLEHSAQDQWPVLEGERCEQQRTFLAASDHWEMAAAALAHTDELPDAEVGRLRAVATIAADVRHAAAGTWAGVAGANVRDVHESACGVRSDREVAETHVSTTNTVVISTGEEPLLARPPSPTMGRDRRQARGLCSPPATCPVFASKPPRSPLAILAAVACSVRSPHRA